MIKSIPSLGETASDVLKNALNYPVCGYLLKFEIIGEGSYYFDFQDNNYKKVRWFGNFPTSENCGNLFDDWLLEQISKGFVGIWVSSHGKNPYFTKEIHRARGIKIPME